MASATRKLKDRGGENGNLLHGSDLKKSELSITILITAVREAPAEWGSALVADIEETHGCQSWALNKTNTKKLVELIDDDYEQWVGYEVVLDKVRVTNPSGGGLVDSLAVASAKKSKRKVKLPF